MRSPLLFVLLGMASLTASGQSVVGDASSGGTTVQEIAPAELAGMIEAANVFIYDCNEADMFAEAHVPGAVLTVYDALTADSLPADRSAPLVFYCYSPECPAGCSAARTATKLGFTTVYCMTAGITGWQDAGLATEP